MTDPGSSGTPREAFGIDIGKITEMMDQRFGVLIERLDTLITEVQGLRGDVRALEQQ